MRERRPQLGFERVGRHEASEVVQPPGQCSRTRSPKAMAIVQTLTTSLNETMHVIHARAAGLDVHEMQITAAVRLGRPGIEAQVFTRQFWLHGVIPDTFGSRVYIAENQQAAEIDDPALPGDPIGEFGVGLVHAGRSAPRRGP